MDVVVLAGGRGTRALPFTADRPKALLPLAGRAIVEHVLGIYAEQGFRRFVLAVGHRAEAIEDHFRAPRGDLDVRLSRTAPDADTATRLREAARLVDAPFFATYADGLADVDLHALRARHVEAGRSATVTVVPLRSPFGTVELADDDVVRDFVEKPTVPGITVNGGFFVFEREALEAPGTSLERDVLPALARAGRLAAHRHDGFWRSVDTFKDLEELETMVADGRARWAGLKAAASS